MAKILLIISALVIAATAYLGFATKGKVDALTLELSAKKTALGAAQTEASNAKKAQKTAEVELIAAKATIDEKEKDIAAKKGEIDGLGAKLKETGDSLAASLAQIEEYKKITTPVEGGGGLEQLKKDFEDMKIAKAKAEADATELRAVKETLDRQLAEEKSKTSSAQTVVQSYKADYMRPGVTGTVLAYNPGWNFIVINIGDRQTVKAGKEMVVTRDGQMIAKVRVKTVEPASSIADVIPSSLAKGQSVQPGDSVIYEGRSK